MPAPPPKAKTPTPPRKPSAPPAAAPAPATDFTVGGGTLTTAHKVVVYGPGGVGKTELCSLLDAVGCHPVFIDLEEGSGYIDVDRLEPTPENWVQLRSALHQPQLWTGGAVVIDSLTKAEEMAVAWTLENVKHEKGHKVDSIEGYGYGKGLVHVYETFLQLLGDMDALARRGQNIICTAHDCTANVPNPSGEDWIRYEPRLQSPASGKSSIRHRVKEWCGHLLYIGFDAAVSKDGKAVGGGTRTIYTAELPTFWAKSRCLPPEPIPYDRGDASVWKLLFGKE